MSAPYNGNAELKKELDELIEKTRKDYLKWYSQAVGWSKYGYLFSQNFIIALGFVTALIAAFQDELDKWWAKALLITLPSLSAFTASLLTQFKLYEVWKIREDGRLEFEIVMNDIRGKAVMAKTDTDLYNVYNELNDKINLIESDALRKYFALSSSEFIANFKKST